MTIKTWQERRAYSNGQWPEDECMREEIDELRVEREALREALEEVISAERHADGVATDAELEAARAAARAAGASAKTVSSKLNA